VHHTMDILKYKGKFTSQNCEWNETSVDKIKGLRQLADVALESQQQITEMPSEDTDSNVFMGWTDKVHYTFTPILWEICCEVATHTPFSR